MDDDMANLIVAQLLYLDSADQERDITMYVNSPGGSVTAGARARGQLHELWHCLCCRGRRHDGCVCMRVCVCKEKG